MAFERYLDRRGTPYVAVESVRHFARRRVGLKAFDYIVYPASERPCLVDVKGRKCSPRSGADVRQKNWVTRGDVRGLLSWREVFGPEYDARFVFSYWVPEGGSPAVQGDAELVSFAGRRYSFWLVDIEDYAGHQKRLSRSWDTVCVPRDVFRGMSRRLETCWPSAPC